MQFDDTFVKDDYSDIDSFEHGWEPARPFRGGLDTLPDGDYDFEIVDGELTRTQNGDRIFQCGLKVHGNVVQKTWWLKSQENANALCADLCALGLDADKWGAKFKRPLSEELPKAAKSLVGVRFRGKVTTRVSQGKTYHNLHIGGRIMGQAMPALPATPPDPTSTEDIPF